MTRWAPAPIDGDYCFADATVEELAENGILATLVIASRSNQLAGPVVQHSRNLLPDSLKKGLLFYLEWHNHFPQPPLRLPTVWVFPLNVRTHNTSALDPKGNIVPTIGFGFQDADRRL